jgi:molecular chaperone GrpE
LSEDAPRKGIVEPNTPSEDADASPGGAADADASEQLRQRARLAEDRLAEVLAAYRQVKSENEGFRERVSRNLERRFDQRREKLLLKFIDILDNLDRALEAAEKSYAGDPLIEGLILVRTQLLQTLKEEGLERIPALGLPYDPNFSEAVGTQPVDDPDQHHLVVKELLRGYRLHGRVARASRVVVGEYGEATPVETPPDDLIGADEVAPTREVAAEDSGPREPSEPGPEEDTLEQIIARAELRERDRDPEQDDPALREADPEESPDRED